MSDPEPFFSPTWFSSRLAQGVRGVPCAFQEPYQIDHVKVFIILGPISQRFQSPSCPLRFLHVEVIFSILGPILRWLLSPSCTISSFHVLVFSPRVACETPPYSLMVFESQLDSHLPPCSCLHLRGADPWLAGESPSYRPMVLTSCCLHPFIYIHFLLGSINVVLNNDWGRFEPGRIKFIYFVHQ